MLTNLAMIMNFGEGEFGWVSTALQTAYDNVKGIATALMLLVTAICLLGMLFSKNQKTVEEYKSWFKRILVCYVIFICLGSITSGISQIVSSGASSENAFEMP